MLVQVDRNPMAGPCKHSPTWRISDSELFGKRKLDCDAKDLVDTQDVFEKQFELDWQRVAAKQRFLRLIETTDKTKLSTSKQELARGVQAAPLVGCLVCAAQCWPLLDKRVPQSCWTCSASLCCNAHHCLRQCALVVRDRCVEPVYEYTVHLLGVT